MLTKLDCPTVTPPWCVQIYDELVLEGPEEYAEAAKKLLVSIMEKPFGDDHPLLIETPVNCNSTVTWYDAK